MLSSSAEAAFAGAQIAIESSIATLRSADMNFLFKTSFQKILLNRAFHKPIIIISDSKRFIKIVKAFCSMLKSTNLI